jgi:hypothetical protein
MRLRRHSIGASATSANRSIEKAAVLGGSRKSLRSPGAGMTGRIRSQPPVMR